MLVLSVLALSQFISVQVHLFFTCYWLHSKKNSCQQMSKMLLLWQVGLIANVKLHFLFCIWTPDCELFPSVLHIHTKLKLFCFKKNPDHVISLLNNKWIAETMSQSSNKDDTVLCGTWNIHMFLLHDLSLNGKKFKE